MNFDVAAQAYDRFMGRWSTPLAAPFVDLAGIAPGERVLDVGCGPGALTGVLVDRCGPTAVSAVDPSESFVAAVAARWAGVDVRRASAADLPFGDGRFDAALAQLVVHFLPDPVAGIAEMARVTRTGGRLAASVWDFATGRAPLSVFWQAVHVTDPLAADESERPGVGSGELGALFTAAGLVDVAEGELTVYLDVPTFDDWWQPFTTGVGPAGAYVAALAPPARAALRERCRELLPPAPVRLAATAWTAVGVAAG